MTSSTLEQNIPLQVRLWVGQKIFKALGPTVFRISRGRVIKGPCQLAELEAMKYVSQNTSIPVPNVYSTYTYLGKLYIEMDYIKGETLEEAWVGGHLSQDEKKSVVKELAGFIVQLRNLMPPKEELVASADLHRPLDYRVGTTPFGPFDNHRDFHSFLRGHIALDNCTQVYGDQVTTCHSRQYRSVFSHSDLAQRNIIVRNGKIAAIVDWAFAGWYPEYWEYTKAHYGLLNIPDWYSEFKDSVTRYDDELTAERALWEQFDEPGMAYQWIDKFKNSASFLMSSSKASRIAEERVLPFCQG
ncbi:hypothetical protein B7463_g1910, partial [Scytalidium lignicola]